MRRNPAPLLVAAAVAALLLGGCSGGSALRNLGASGQAPQLPSLHPAVDDLPAAVVRLTSTTGDEVRVDVRVAASPGERRRGLMHVPELPEGTGMLFVYGAERTGGFWMRDVLVPLDIAFVAPDGQVRAVLTMPTCAEDPCPVHDPGVAYDRALEVPAGWFHAEGITPGATLETVTGGG